MKLSKDVIIRRATTSDVSNLTVLKQQVWISTYATEGIREEFSNYVLSEFTREKVLETIKNDSIIILIAEVNNHLVGCIEINIEPTESIPEVKPHPEIAVLYVLERFARKGIGSNLLNNALMQLKESGFKAAWLSVYHENENALKFYTTFHFKQVGKIYFEMDGNKYENKVLLHEISLPTLPNIVLCGWLTKS